jgi:hypothetical protein
MRQQSNRFGVRFQEARFASDFVAFGRSGRICDRAQVILTDSQPTAAHVPLANLRFHRGPAPARCRTPVGFTLYAPPPDPALRRTRFTRR